jgi:pyridoxamine 5'-phosphate oxidase
MIIFKKIIQDEPYIILKQKYDEAFAANQQNIEAISISSFNKETNEVESRYVNLKFIDQNEFVFFSNYNSPKSLAFNTHDQISALFYWPSINTQIRMKARIKKT